MRINGNTDVNVCKSECGAVPTSSVRAQAGQGYEWGRARMGGRQKLTVVSAKNGGEKAEEAGDQGDVVVKESYG